MSDFPTTKQELERKSLETLEAALAKHSAGRLSSEAAVQVARTVWDVTTGLVDPSVTSLATQMCDEIRHTAEHKAIYLRRKSGQVVRIRYRTEAPGMVVRFYGNTNQDDVVKEVPCEPGQDRADKIKLTIQSLIKGGYEII